MPVYYFNHDPSQRSGRCVDQFFELRNAVRYLEQFFQTPETFPGDGHVFCHCDGTEGGPDYWIKQAQRFKQCLFIQISSHPENLSRQDHWPDNLICCEYSTFEFSTNQLFQEFVAQCENWVKR